VDRYDPQVKPDSFFNAFRFYQDHTNQDFGKNTFQNNGLVTTQANDYRHGVFKSSGNDTYADNDIVPPDNDIFPPKDGGGACNPDNNCYLLNVYLQINKVSQPSICVEIPGTKVTNCGDYPTPLLAKAIEPIHYDNSDFQIVKTDASWHNDFSHFFIWNVYNYQVIGERPRMSSLTVDRTFSHYAWGHCDTTKQPHSGSCWGTYREHTFSPGLIGQYFLSTENTTDPKRSFYTFFDVPAILGAPLEKSRTFNEVVHIIDTYGNEQDITLTTCFGDAC